MAYPIIEGLVRTNRHTTFYLSCGAAEAPLIIFVHGWPELSISWRHQLRCFADLGFRAVAPDMRGYGQSSVYGTHADYAIEPIVEDMLELLAALGREKAVWVGHDWGCPVVWSLATHHPERCAGVAGLCVPYLPGGFTRANREPLIDRSIYPEQQYPAGQWDYQLFYEEHFEKARASFEANIENTVKVLFRKGDPAGQGKPARLASVRNNGGWFGAAGQAPAVPMDRDVISDEEFHRYVTALKRNGFFGPNSWYMNDARNAAYGRMSAHGDQLAMPVLFFHAAYDYTCETLGSRFAEPMRRHCDRLTEVTVHSGHWMSQEKPVQVNAGLAKWLAVELQEFWAG